MTARSTTPRTLLDTVRTGPERFSEYVAPVWRLHILLIVICAIGVAAVWALDRPGRPTAVTAAALIVQAIIFAATIRALRAESAAVRRWPYAVVTILSALTAISGYFFGPNSGFAGLIALVLVLARLFTGGWGVRSSQALAWTVYTSLAGAQAAVVALVVTGVLPDASLVPLIPEGHDAWRTIAAHGAIQTIWLGAFLLGRLLQRTYGELATRAADANRVALQREALLQEARAEYERALFAGTRGVFTGQEIGGYRMGELLGRGGMGEIYDAVNIDSGARAAVKLLRGDQLRHRSVVESFLREADVLGRVASTHVARVYAAGGLDDAIPFIAMEHLAGRDLAALLREGEPLGAVELRRLASDVAAGLEAAHGAGIVHRDLTPRNVVRSEEGAEGVWKLVDFGIALARDAEVAGAPPIGTLPFMAPELLRGSAPDPRSDVYGFAAVLYAAVTARDPFEPGPAAPLIAAVLERMPPSPMHYSSQSEDVAAVLRIGLAKDPSMRFPTPAALADAMLAALDGRLDDSARVFAAELCRRQAWGEVDDAPTIVAPRRLSTSAEGTLTVWDPAPPSDRPAASAPPEPTRDYRGARVPEPTEAQSAPPPAAGWAAPPPAAQLWRASADSDSELAYTADTDVWLRALQRKTVTVMVAFLALCAGGIPLVVLLSMNRTGTIVAVVGIAGIALVTGLLLRRARRGTVEQLNWPWAIVAIFCAGPCFYFGLNAGFAAVIVVGLFSNGGFTTAQSNPSAFTIPVAVALSQGTLVGLVLTGAVPDLGLVPLQAGGTPAWQAAFAHGLVQIIYMSAHVAGFMVDRKHGRLLADAIRAAREAAEQRALLSASRAQLRRALAGDAVGVFCGHRVGDYELAAFIGRGGMGEVYDATHASTGQRAAVKLIRADRFGDRETVERFVREATALARIDSPHVARVYAAGGDTGEGDVPFIAMELLEGRTLAELLRDRDALRRDELRAMVAGVGAGLRAVHDAGVIHRDLKPANVMLVGGGPPRWKLVDFGIAKLLDTGTTHTSRQVILGTPAYMAPEQAIGRDVDARTDLYAFGLVIYRALVGRPAWVVNDPAGLLDATGRAGPPDPRYYVELPRDLERVLRIALAAEPSARFQSAAGMCIAFDAAFEDRLDPALRRRADELLVRAPWSPRA